MEFKFANGKVYEAKDIDDAITQCLMAGDDPFNPVEMKKTKQEKKPKNADPVIE